MVRQSRPDGPGPVNLKRQSTDPIEQHGWTVRQPCWTVRPWDQIPSEQKPRIVHSTRAKKHTVCHNWF
jgi:hypothetical protein